MSKMHGVSVAVDCLERYTGRVRGDAAALNMFGALLEREGLFRRAAAALRDALACLDEERDAELCNKVVIIKASERSERALVLDV